MLHTGVSTQPLEQQRGPCVKVVGREGCHWSWRCYSDSSTTVLACHKAMSETVFELARPDLSQASMGNHESWEH